MNLVEFFDFAPENITKKWVKENMTINKYIPLIDKYADAKIISKVILDIAEDTNYKDNFETNFIYMKYDIYSTMTIFSRYINIEITDEEKTVTNYDRIFSSGLFDIVMEYCEKDFNRFVEIIDRIVGIDDLSIYRELGKALNSDAYFDRLEKSKKILNGISLKKYETLKEINNLNNPLIKEVSDILKASAVKEALEKQQDAVKNGKK